jgi:hypothetical protein
MKMLFQIKIETHRGFKSKFVPMTQARLDEFINDSGQDLEGQDLKDFEESTKANDQHGQLGAIFHDYKSWGLNQVDYNDQGELITISQVY